MNENTTQSGWISDRSGLSMLTVASGILAVALLLTQLPYILLAIVLAYLLYPVQRILERYVSPMAGAIVLTSLSVSILLFSLGVILIFAVQQGLELYGAIRSGVVGLDSIQQRVATIGYEIDIDLLLSTYKEPIFTGLERVATGSMTIISGLAGLVVGLTVTAFVLFALLRDGEQLLAWMEDLIPVSDQVQEELYEKIDALMWASVVGNAAVAAIGAVLMGIGLVAVGMPGALFLTLVTFVFGLLPLIGAFGVWLPVSGYLFAIGRPRGAVILAIIGAIVSVSDIYLRPVIINRGGELNVAVITVGIFGGIILFGAIGLFIGPVVLGGSKVVLDLYSRERGKSITS